MIVDIQLRAIVGIEEVLAVDLNGGNVVVACSLDPADGSQGGGGAEYHLLPHDDEGNGGLTVQ